MRTFLSRLVVLTSLVLMSVGCRHSDDSAPPPTLRVMSYNIHHGEGMDGRIDLERIAKLIREQNVDLVALQEVDRGTERTGRRNLAAELAELTGMQEVFGRNIDYQGGAYGNAILSKLPVRSWTNLHYRMVREGEQRGLLSAVIGVGRGSITFASTHLDHRPDPTERISNVGEIRTFARELNTPLILAGDFNARPESEPVMGLQQFLDDAWGMIGPDDGFTYSSRHPASRIDYLFLYPKGAWTVVETRVLDSQASDHRPLVAEIRLHP